MPSETPHTSGWTVTASASAAVPITPSDSTTFAIARAVYIGSSGALTVRMASGMDATFPSAPVGVLPIQVDRIYFTGTSATGLLALY